MATYEMPLSELTISVTAYPGTAQIIAGGTIASFSFQNLDYNDIVYFSFDGTTTNGYILPGPLLEGVALPGPQVNYFTTKQSVWLKLKTAGTAAVNVMGAG